MFFMYLSSDSWPFYKQLMTKSEPRFGFKSLGNHEHIKSNISLNKEKYQKEKRVVSPSLIITFIV